MLLCTTKIICCKLVWRIKTLFIVPTDAHYYNIIEMLKQFKIVILGPTCFGSRRNHQQGAVLYLAKTTNMVFCARRYRRSQCYGGISACCAGVRFNRTPAQHFYDFIIVCIRWNNKKCSYFYYIQVISKMTSSYALHNIGRMTSHVIYNITLAV